MTIVHVEHFHVSYCYTIAHTQTIHCSRSFDDNTNFRKWRVNVLLKLTKMIMYVDCSAGVYNRLGIGHRLVVWTQFVIKHLYDISNFTTKRGLFVVQIKLKFKRAPSWQLGQENWHVYFVMIEIHVHSFKNSLRRFLHSNFY